MQFKPVAQIYGYVESRISMIEELIQNEPDLVIRVGYKSILKELRQLFDYITQA